MLFSVEPLAFRRSIVFYIPLHFVRCENTARMIPVQKNCHLEFRMVVYPTRLQLIKYKGISSKNAPNVKKIKSKTNFLKPIHRIALAHIWLHLIRSSNEYCPSNHPIKLHEQYLKYWDFSSKLCRFWLDHIRMGISYNYCHSQATLNELKLKEYLKFWP